jgi:DNA-binding PadR family transcriptional regulator
MAAGVGYRKDDNAFLWVEDPAALRAAAERFLPEIVQRRLNYWTVAVGPKFSKRDRRNAKLERSYYLHQVEYCLNFVFKRNYPIRKLFERSCELSLWRMTGEKIWRAFGKGHRDRIKGKLQTIMDGIEHGQHVFRAYWKHAWVKQYEKFRTFLRLEVTSNNLRDFKLHKGLAYLEDVRERLYQVVDRFAGQQAVNLNVHDDFTLLRRIGLPLADGRKKVPGIRVQDVRIIRLLEVLLHTGSAIGGRASRQIHEAVLDRFELSPDQYSLSSLRYDLRKLKGHGLLEREQGQYTYRLTEKGQRVAVLFLLFHQRLCGPLASGQFGHRPNERYSPRSPLERAYYKADHAIDQIVSMLRAA